MQPVVLGPNQPRQFYKGGAAIAALRGLNGQSDFGPEDWVASTTGRFGLGDDGLSRLPDGRYLRDVIEANPAQWLGPDHVEYFGAEPALLVKLLDAGQRLPVHVHPDRTFAVRHLGSRHGKTEAWVVLGVEGAEPVVYLGWARDVEPDELSRWVGQQDTATMLGQMHKLTVQAGDTVLVPAGTVHAIGAGVFSLELQEPTDFSVMLEVKGFDIDPARGYVGLDRELAISCVHNRSLNDREIDALRSRPGTSSARRVAEEDTAGAIEELLPEAAKPYFRAQRVRGGAGVNLEPSFAVVVATSGEGVLSGDGWQLPVRRGSSLVVPWEAGTTKVEGRWELLRCLPPLPADAAKDDPGAGTRL
jgi:mannose-6-phosphate isomerase